MRERTLLAVAVICTVLPLAAQFYGDRAGGWLMIDFRAYYCASLAQRHGENPYYARSLTACEHATPAPFYRPPARVTVPAPYPPYALAMFHPLSFVPFAAAAVLWWLVLVLAVLLSAYALARVADQPAIVAWSALALSLGLASLTAGNVLPLSVAAIVVAALLAQRERYVAAAIALAVAMVEPQIALPAAVAVFARFPATRLPLALAAVVLAGACVATAGIERSVAYATVGLPAHALSEVSRDNQYSISTVLAALGVSDGAAALAGSASYVVAGAIGVLVGLRLARRYGEPALVVLVPPAFSLLGGAFVHTGEIAAAVPASLLVFTRATAYRSALLLALLLLAVPWMLATSAAMFLAPAVPVAYLTYELWRRDRAAGSARGSRRSLLSSGSSPSPRRRAART